MKKNLKLCSFVLVFIFLFSSASGSFAASSTDQPALFADVPQTSYAFNDINSLRSLGVTTGIGNNKFGYGSTILRGEFVTFLVRLMGWELLTPAEGSFSDNQKAGEYYYRTVETALAHGVIKKDTDKFRPLDPITREEMAVMIVRCIGYDHLPVSGRLDYLPKPFPDVTENSMYITIAKDMGIVNGTPTGFLPKGTALREEAAAMMMRMYNRFNAPIKDLNAFYAISSNSQRDLMTDFSSICFGWSRLTFDAATGGISLNTVRDGTALQEYYVPEGFSERLATARANNIPALLNVLATQATLVTDAQTNETAGLLQYLLTRPELCEKLISDIADNLANVSRSSETGNFDGVVIDFEGMKGETLKQAFNAFLKALREKLGPDKKIYVMVPPVAGRSMPYYDAYDYRTIGEIADKVILMAHDYAAKKLNESEMASGWTVTPLTPIYEIYQALRSITDKDTGVADKSKIMLQLSFEWLGWQKKDGKVLNSSPDVYGLSKFLELFDQSPTVEYPNPYRNPYLKLVDEAGVEHVVWYEDSRSIIEKIMMAKMFGINGISVWRLGNIPVKDDTGKIPYMDVWDTILKSKE